MKTKQLTNVALSLSCCLAALTACVGEETEVFPPEKQPVGISATITGEVTTKAEPDYKPASDTKIYMYYKNGGNTTTGEKGIYTYNGASWNAADELLNAGDRIFWDDLVAVSGKYPFFAVSPKDPAGVTTGSVETDQSSEPNFANADLLMAYSEVARQAKVPLIFKHMLAKLTVKVNTGVVSASINQISVSVKDAIKEYTVAYTGTLSGDSPAKITTGSERNATFTPHTESTESNGKVYVYSVILPAQDISSAAAKVKTTITISSPGSTEDLVYTYAPDPAPLTVTKLANGKNTILTLTVNGTVLELGDVKVTNWNEVSADGNISLDK